MGKKGLEKKIARRIFKHLIAAEKDILLDENMNIWRNTDWTKLKGLYEMPEKEFDDLMKEYMIKELGFEPVTVGIYKEIRSLRHKFEKEFQIREEEEQIKKEHEIQKRRKELGNSIWKISDDIRIASWQFWNGLYREHIYDNMLWWVENLRNTVESLAELDLSPSEYEDLLSFKGFNLERFLSADPEISKKLIYPYLSNVSYESKGSDMDCLKMLRLGWLSSRKYTPLDWRRKNPYNVPIRDRKEEYLVAFELINRIEKRARELIRNY